MISLRRLTVLFLLLSVVPLVLLAYSSVTLASGAVSEEVEAKLSSTATTSAEVVATEMEGLAQLVASYARRPSLVAALGDGDLSRRRLRLIQLQLEELQRSHPGMVNAGLSDPRGRLIGVAPETPAIVGQDFSFRDWYRGATFTGRPYVSEAVESAAVGHPLVVPASALVRGRDNEVIGVLVAAYGLDYLQQFSNELAVAQGVTLKITDQRGVLVASPGTKTTGLISRRGDPRVADALRGRAGITELDTPDGRRLSAYAPVPEIGWTVTASVPADAAFAAVSDLRATVVGIAGALGLALLGGLVFLLRTLRARERAEAEANRLATINRVVLDATPAGIALIDPEGRRLLTNKHYERFATPGGTDGDAQARIEAAAVATHDPDGFRAKMAAVLADPEHETTERFDLADGRSTELYTAPVREGGQLIGRIVTVRDISAEREAERLKSELLATVSHELRTPLASILGFAELLVARDLDVDTRERYLNTIYGEAKRLTALINDFLDLQRIEQGHFTLALEPFDLRDVIAEQVALFSGQSAAHTVALDAPEPIVVLGERDRISQVAANLVSNAIKYSPAGGRVTVSVARGGGAARVSVGDEGLGIPADEQRHIFQKFFRVDSAERRAIGGTGLGLALARDIVEAHGGRIGFESTEGKGSTFWFELPVAERSSTDGNGRRVLVIEDDLPAATLLSEYLVADGYAVQIAATGEDGLAHALADPPLLVCLDIALAGALDGWDVLARLKENPTTAAVPVIICTGRNGRDRAAALGAADFVTKPFSRDRLRDALQRILPAGEGSILIVDDEDNVRRLVFETLRGGGFELSEARDGEEALAAVAARPPDAIVLDLVMPGLDGFSVLERLQADPATRSIPVVVLTAKRLSGAERQLLQQRALSLLEKSSYSTAELRRLVAQAVGLSPAGARQYREVEAG